MSVYFLSKHDILTFMSNQKLRLETALWHISWLFRLKRGYWRLFLKVWFWIKSVKLLWFVHFCGLIFHQINHGVWILYTDDQWICKISGCKKEESDDEFDGCLGYENDMTWIQISSLLIWSEKDMSLVSWVKDEAKNVSRWADDG